MKNDELRKPESKKQFCFAMILLLANRFQTKLDKYTGELTLKQWLLLCMLNSMKSDKVNVNELASVMGCSRQNAKKLVDMLTEKGYLQLQESTMDKRTYQIFLTEKTRQFFAEFEHLGDELLEQIFETIDEEQLTTVGNIMEILSNNIDRM